MLYDRDFALHILTEGEGLKEWTMGAPLFTFKMQKEVRGSTPPFLNEGNGTGGPLFTFSMKEWTMGAPLFTFSMKEQARGSAHNLLKIWTSI